MSHTVPSMWFLTFMSLLVAVTAQMKYNLYKQRLKWTDAEKLCQKLGGHLATAKNEEQNRFLAAKLRRNNVSKAWIGLNDRSTEGLWTWVSSSAGYRFVNFRHGEPNGGKSQNCVEISRNGLWNDVRCNGRKPFICERYVGKCATEKPCHEKALCENTQTTYTCTCICGYEGDGKTCVESKSFFQNNAVTINNKCAIRKGNLLAEMDIGKEYMVRFQIYPMAFIKQAWASVVHLSAFGENLSMYGDRNPAVWIRANQLLVCSAVSGNKNKCETIKFTALSLKEWTQITIKQTKNTTNNGYTYSVSINGSTEFKIANSDPWDFSKVAVYLGNPWHKAQAGYIRSLYVGDGISIGSNGMRKNKPVVIAVLVVILLLATIVAIIVVVRTWKRCNAVKGDSRASPIEHVDSVFGEGLDDDYDYVSPDSHLTSNIAADEHEYTYIDPKSIEAKHSVGSSQLKFENLSLETKGGKFAKYISTSPDHLYKEPSGVPRCPPPQHNNSTQMCNGPTTDGGTMYENLDRQVAEDYEDPSCIVSGDYEDLRESTTNEYISPNTDEYEPMRSKNVYEPVGLSNCSLNYETMKTNGGTATYEVS